MKVAKIPANLPNEALPGADWADCYQLHTLKHYENALEAAHAIIGKPPAWVSNLLTLRNIVVAPLGLKGTRDIAGQLGKNVGTFPVLAEEDHRVVLGADDRHLDFRAVVDHDVVDGITVVTATTLVKRHNLLGRTYLAAIMPFHKLILWRTLSAAGR